MMDMDSLLRKMKEKKASDLHLVSGVPPAFRINGELRFLDRDVLSSEKIKSLVYPLMGEKQRVIFEREKDLDFSYGISGVGRFRINVHYQRSSIAAAIRLIPYSIPSLEELNLPSIIGQLCLKDKGLILVTGPTGSGKSTTLASMINIINQTKPVHIVIIEDPIEYLHSHKKGIVEQREVGGDTVSFANSLKYCLRQDPDVIMIGEMRDLETISTAITAAETGHLVMATLHTPNAPGAIDRIVDVFPPYQQPQIRLQLSTTLIAIIAQILIPRMDNTGRIPAVELLISTPAVSNLIRSGKTHQLYNTMQTGSQVGMQTMDQSLINLVKKRLISKEDALSRARDARLVKESLSRFS
ncbi:MAG TPA: type IV pilus twitching motility protein PilT [Candidatus Aerophobetes bacterium]|uniref:Type IV pilus twitching motility protein PilT n=1 Tax=Aerophobetes bacterium TaxID=2030807 RepID=A0A7V0QRQ0_UNCAE|nr:type IV pilus twitching motility protein PilT [Candidatus Aerophobetes bacterium]